MAEPRPLEVRLREYATAMRSTANQMIEMADQIDGSLAHRGEDSVVGNTGPIREGARLYLLFADDLDKIVAGEELKPFMVTGVI